MRKTNEQYFKGLKGRGEFGGSLLKGNPREQRPFDSSLALHLTLRSDVARGPSRLDNHEQKILTTLERLSRRFKVTIYMFANAGNHLHLLLRPPRNRGDFASFLRALAGITARIASGAQRGAAKGVKFWATRPWSRLVAWGRDYKTVYRYVCENIMAAWGIEAVAEMEKLLRSWRKGAAPA